MTDDPGVWAYAITEHGGGDLSRLTGVAGAKVRAAVAGGFTVLVSDVDLGDFGEVALRRNLENLAWLEEVARAHHNVIDAAARLFPLLPTRLATVYSSDRAMAGVLARHCQELRAALRRVGGRVEWGVKAYAVPEAATRDGEEPGPAKAGRTGTGAGGAGLAYLSRRRAQLTARESSRQAALAGARAIHAELSGRAAQARLHPPQSAQLSGDRMAMLLNAAYLLDASASAGFASAVAAAATAHPELRVELTGPWPPYSFAGGEDG